MTHTSEHHQAMRKSGAAAFLSPFWSFLVFKVGVSVTRWPGLRPHLDPTTICSTGGGQIPFIGMRTEYGVQRWGIGGRPVFLVHGGF